MQRAYHFRTNGLKRTMAFFIDIIPIIMTAVLVSSACFDMKPLAIFDDASRGTVRDEGIRVDIWIVSISFLVWMVYCAIAECTSMAGSFGKKAMGLWVCDLQGNPSGFWRALARNACKIFSVIPPCLGFFWAVVTPHGRAWHDWMTGTAVVEH